MINKTDKAINQILNMKEDFAMFILFVISLVILGSIIIYAIYLTIVLI